MLVGWLKATPQQHVSTVSSGLTEADIKILSDDATTKKL
jgi:hypothetical protein